MMNDIHSFFTDRILQLSAETSLTFNEDTLIGKIDQTLSSLRWMIACLNSNSIEDEVSIVASEILKEF